MYWQAGSAESVENDPTGTSPWTRMLVTAMPGPGKCRLPPRQPTASVAITVWFLQRQIIVRESWIEKVALRLDDYETRSTTFEPGSHVGRLSAATAPAHAKSMMPSGREAQ
jgi:hypothetical protein